MDGLSSSSARLKQQKLFAAHGTASSSALHFCKYSHGKACCVSPAPIISLLSESQRLLFMVFSASWPLRGSWDAPESRQCPQPSSSSLIRAAVPRISGIQSYAPLTSIASLFMRYAAFAVSSLYFLTRTYALRRRKFSKLLPPQLRSCLCGVVKL